MNIVLCHIAREFDSIYDSDLSKLERNVAEALQKAGVLGLRDGIWYAKYEQNAPNSWVLREEWQV